MALMRGSGSPRRRDGRYRAALRLSRCSPICTTPTRRACEGRCTPDVIRRRYPSQGKTGAVFSQDEDTLGRRAGAVDAGEIARHRTDVSLRRIARAPTPGSEADAARARRAHRGGGESRRILETSVTDVGAPARPIGRPMAIDRRGAEGDRRLRIGFGLTAGVLATVVPP